MSKQTSVTASYGKWFNVYYGQNQEDLILKSLFPHVTDGFYVDVGAQDPVKFSVTKLFYDEGWSGINIEPQDAFYKLLQKDRPRDTNLQVVLAERPGSVKLREYPDATGLSTVSDAVKQKYESKSDSRLAKVAARYHEYDVTALTLKTVLEKYAAGRVIHFLKIDVEGYELNVIQGNDWNKFRPQVVCVESNNANDVYAKELNKAKYHEFLFDGLNRYYIADEAYEGLIAGFDYAAVVLNRVPISSVPFDLFMQDIAKLDAYGADLRGRLESQDTLIHQQEAEIARLKALLSPDSRVRRKIITLATKQTKGDDTK